MATKSPTINYEYIVGRQVDRISIKISDLESKLGGDEREAATYGILNMINHLETLLIPHLKPEYFEKKELVHAEMEAEISKDSLHGVPLGKMQKWLKLLIIVAHNSGILSVYTKEHEQDLEEASEMEEVKDD